MFSKNILREVNIKYIYVFSNNNFKENKQSFRGENIYKATRKRGTNPGTKHWRD